EIRRRFIDWGMFHVEHRSRSVWRNFNRALLQRNSLLRHGKISADELSYWDSQFAALSEQLTQYRRQQFERLKSLTLEEIRTLDGIEGLELSFQQGWEENAELETLLAERLERDKRQRATSAGAHRADIRITINGSPAREVLSRGQMKVVVCGMKLAQARLMRAATGHNPLLLLDDLPAELDASHRQKVLRRLLGEGAQVFVTSVSRDEILSGNHADLGEFDLPLAEDKVKLFHVKHGNITAM
ncbi:MAG: DNA replication/repair protein RecF, partial [bacterium]